ncbi:MAG: RNA polymerase sigma factor [Clostridia bacterium]|nr:RNA polymerase sigma factor [Clostridia bacterium]
MEDRDVVALYFERREEALLESDKKYGRYLYTVAYTILQNAEDAKECVSDCYLRAWNAIPPESPRILRAYLAKITRNLALNVLKKEQTQKRAGQVDEALDELYGCLSNGSPSVEDELALKDVVNRFLAGLSKKKRIVFMQRYWYFLSVGEIAEKNGMSEGAVKVSLLRTRNAFKKHLEKEGITL